jgi:hypothetical protein
MAAKHWTFHVDPRGGWLQVRVEDVENLGISDRISLYSYRDGDDAYLEDDGDAGLFIEEYLRQTGMKRHELDVSIKSKTWNDDAPCRSFGRYCLQDAADDESGMTE